MMDNKTDEQKFELFIKALKDNNLEEMVNPNALISIDVNYLLFINEK